MGTLIKIAVPNGIGTAMESLTKAILEEQPVDIYKFAYQYFLSKVQNRQEAEMPGSSEEESNVPTKDSTAGEVDVTEKELSQEVENVELSDNK